GWSHRTAPRALVPLLRVPGPSPRPLAAPRARALSRRAVRAGRSRDDELQERAGRHAVAARRKGFAVEDEAFAKFHFEALGFEPVVAAPLRLLRAAAQSDSRDPQQAAAGGSIEHGQLDPFPRLP